MSVMSDAKRQYMMRDLSDWCDYCRVEFKWPTTFPIRSVLPLRLTLAAKCDPNLIKAICKCAVMSFCRWLNIYPLLPVAAAWRDNKDIANKEVDIVFKSWECYSAICACCVSENFGGSIFTYSVHTV